MSSLNDRVQGNLANVIGRISRAAHAVSRDPDGIGLLAVSKTFGVAEVLAAARAGQRAFGENYVQEAVEKMTQAAAQWSGPPLQWHMIGPIQSNKTRAIAEHFDWVHSVDRLKVAQRLAQQRPAERPALQVLLQVNVSGEASKSGVAPEELPALALAVAALPRLRLRGLMAVPAPTDDMLLQRSAFARLRACLERLRRQLPDLSLDTLSMGMSADLESAIAEGSTLVRVGTAIFGARSRPATDPIA